MKRAFYLVVFLLCYATNVQAQKLTGRQGQFLIDSLLKELPKAKNDTNRINLLNHLSAGYSGIHPKKGIGYGRQALQLSGRLNWDKGIATAYNNIAANYFEFSYDTVLIYSRKAIEANQNQHDKLIEANAFLNMGNCLFRYDIAQGNEYFQNALKLGREADDKLTIAYVQMKISYCFVLLGDYDKSIECAKEALNAARQTNDKLLEGNIISMNALSCYIQGDYKQMLDYFTKALGIFKQYGYVQAEANCLHYMAASYFNLSNYTSAIEYFQKSLKICEDLGIMDTKARSLAGIGCVYSNLSDDSTAIDYHRSSLEIAKAIKNKSLEEGNINNIGDCYENLSDYPRALEYYRENLKINEQQNNERGISFALSNIGHIYLLMYDYTQALTNLQQSLKIAEAFRDIGNLATVFCYLSEICIAAPDTLLKRMTTSPSERYAKALALADSGLRFAIESGSSREQFLAWRLLSTIYQKQSRYKKSLDAYKNYIALRDSTTGEEIKNQITRKLMQFDFDKKLLADSLKNADTHKLSALKLQKQKTYTYTGFAGAIMLLLLSFFIFKNYSTQKKSNKLLSTEKQKSETLLLNILPAEVAEELKETGSAAAKHFDNVTVLFTDFVNFTLLAEKLSPQQLVDELHTCFKAFDDIISKYHIEKIKTIGDAYLAVCGLPVANPRHAENIVNAALEIKDFMLERRKLFGDNTFEIRIGIHSGSVVAGIVGVKKFAYDIWGDTVNTAARLEQNSEAGKINISETTYQLLHLSHPEHSVCDTCHFEYRGEIAAKNKGMMKMYFVN